MFKTITTSRILTRFSILSKNSEQSYKTDRHIPELTKDRYPIKRGKFSEATDKDVKYFETIFNGESNRIINEETEKYNIDFMGSVRGFSKLVLKPKTTEEVSAILKYCNKRKLAVCPQGGNTGLVGGSVPVFDEIVLSLELMNQIEMIDEVSGILKCKAGCILEHLEDSVSEKGLRMPIDMGAKGSCQIGGNVATNAGGLRLLRYGNLHGTVLGLEAVKADGTVLDTLSTLKKDNTGYHLKHLFIGSEGTIGIVTKVAIACPPSAKAIIVAFIGLNSFDDVLKAFIAAKQDLGEILSACEMIDNTSLDCSVNGLKINSPIEQFPFYMLIETSGSRAEHDEDKLTKFLTNGMEAGIIRNGTVITEPSKIKQIWSLREQIASTILNDGYCFKYDISLPLKHFYDVVPIMKKRLGPLAKRVCGYGHIGDSNIHLNVTCEKFTPEIYKLVEPFVYQYTSELNGSISAEHGIGFLKTKYLKYSKNSQAINAMKEIKMLMDPNGILNPYKVLPVD